MNCIKLVIDTVDTQKGFIQGYKREGGERIKKIQKGGYGIRTGIFLFYT